jgi:hypothetical protein
MAAADVRVCSACTTTGSTGYQEAGGSPLRTYSSDEIINATSDFLVDLSDTEGRIDIPIGGEASWCEAYELEVEEPDVELELHLVEIDGVESPSPE